MKLAFLIMVVFISCATQRRNALREDSNIKKIDVTPNIYYKEGIALIAKSDCFACHKVEEILIGPSYRRIAKKHINQTGIEDKLVEKIIKGGSGNWGTLPMPPHPNLSYEDAKAIAKFILTLNQ